VTCLYAIKKLGFILCRQSYFNLKGVTVQTLHSKITSNSISNKRKEISFEHILWNSTVQLSSKEVDGLQGQEKLVTLAENCSTVIANNMKKTSKIRPSHSSLTCYYLGPLRQHMLKSTRIAWLGSWVVSVLDSGAEGPVFKSQSRRCWVPVLGKLFTPIVPLFTK